MTQFKQLKLAGLTALLALGAAAPALAQDEATPEEPRLMSPEIEYTYGFLTTKGLRSSLIVDGEWLADPELLIQLYEDIDAPRVTADGDPLYTPEQTRAMLDRLHGELRERARIESARLTAENIDLSTTWLQTHREASDTIETDSGLIYRVISPGSGPLLVESDGANLRYMSRTARGEVLEDKLEDERPVFFVVGNLIPGWNEGLQLMSAGAEYEFFMPAELAYGSSGTSRTGPEMAMYYRVKIESIEQRSETGE